MDNTPKTETTLPTICKDGEKCFYKACRDANECLGIECPEDGEICGLSKCTSAKRCQHDQYYGNAVKAPTMQGTAEPTKDKVVAPPVKHVPKPPCHTGITHLATLGNGTVLYVGTERAFENAARHFDLYISLLGPPRFSSDGVRKPIVTGNALARAGLPQELFSKPAMELYIDWPDFGVPDVAANFWDALADYLQRESIAVGIYCMGGHGRTGTASAILLSKVGLLADDECPVEVVRSIHCQEAVESTAQVEYIAQVTGRTVRAQPREIPGFTMGTKQDWQLDDFWHKPATPHADKLGVKVEPKPAPVQEVPSVPMSAKARRKLKRKLKLKEALKRKSLLKRDVPF